MSFTAASQNQSGSAMERANNSSYVSIPSGRISFMSRLDSTTSTEGRQTTSSTSIAEPALLPLIEGPRS